MIKVFLIILLFLFIFISGCQKKVELYPYNEPNDIIYWHYYNEPNWWPDKFPPYNYEHEWPDWWGKRKIWESG